MRRLPGWIVAICCFLFLMAGNCAVYAAEPVTLLASGDTQGHVSPCGSCPSTIGLGGLARRATLVEQVRAEGPTLLVDAGNALFGAESLATAGRIIAVGYDAMRYDAMNIGYRDFRLGKQATLDALKASQVPVVSANLFHAGEDRRLFEPYVVIECGQQRWTIIGLTQRPAGLGRMAHLKSQLAGIDIRPPAEILQAVLPEARAAADRVIVLYYGSAVSVQMLMREFEGEQTTFVTVAAGDHPPAEPPSEAPAIAWTHKHGTRMTRIRFAADGADGIQYVDIKADLEPNKALQKEIEPLADEKPVVTKDAQSAAELRYEQIPLQAEFKPGTSFAMRAEAANRAIRFYVDRASFQTRIGDRTAPPGYQWLVLDASFENQIALDLMLDLEYPEPVLIASLPRQLYLVANGQRVLRLAPKAREFSGHLPLGFTLSNVGAVGHGKLVFPVPDQGIESLSLRYYHDQYAPLVLDLMGKTTADVAEPIVKPQANDLMHLEVHGFERRQSYGGQDAPPGLTYAIVDLRGRSYYSIETDAMALDEEANPQAKASLGKVMEYLRASSMLQCVVDGQYAYARVPELETLASVPAWLPDIAVGGKAVFLVPEDVESLELAAHFPLFQDTSGQALGMPAPMRFALVGESSKPEPQRAIAVIKDKPTPVGIMRQRYAPAYGAHQARDGHKLLILTVSMRNESDEGGMFTVANRFRCEATGGQQPPVAVTLPGGVALQEPMWLPTDRRRTFELVFELPVDVQTALLHYKGVSVATAVDLDLGDTQLAHDTPSDPPSQQIDKPMAEGKTQQANAASESPSPAEMPNNVQKPSDVTADTPSDRDVAVAKMDQGHQVTEAALTARPTPPLQARFDQQVGQPIKLNATGSNRAITLTVEQAEFFDTYNANEPEDGHVWLALHVDVKRHATASGLVDNELYRIRAIDEQLLGIIDGRRIKAMRRMRDVENKFPNDLRLKSPGDSASGLVFFELSKKERASFELYLLDEMHGSIHLRLLPTTDWPADEKPIFAQQRNRIAELGVYGFTLQDSFKNDRASRGHTWLVVDVRGRSLLSQQQSENADDVQPNALPLEWRNWADHVQLVIDGRVPVFVERGRYTVHQPFWLLPEVATGGEIGFEVRSDLLEQANTIELVCGFAPTAIPGHAVIAPSLITFTLHGQSPQHSPISNPVFSVDDLDQKLDVVAQHTPERVADNAPGNGHRWLTVDVAVTAKADEGVYFSSADDLYLVDAYGEKHRPHRHTYSSEHAPPFQGKAFWIPPTHRRHFTLIYHLPNQVEQPRLFYKGLLYHQAYALNALPKLPTTAAATSDAQGEKRQLAPRPDKDPHIAADGVRVYYPGREVKGIQGVGLTAEQVNRAIDRGRDFLWQYLQDNAGSSWVGRSDRDLPAMLALIHCDAHKRYPAFDEAVRYYINTAKPNEFTSYQNGLLAMLIESYGDPAFLPKLEQAARYLVESQGEQGTWTYRAPVPSHFFPETVIAEPKDDEALINVVGGRRVEKPDLSDAPLLRSQPWPMGSDGDNSCTQFAVLGLWSAMRAGIQIDADVWRRVLRTTARRQDHSDNPENFGGWAYTRPGTAYGSMTCAGICTTALALKHLDEKVTPREDLRIRNGVSWLIRHFSADQNPEKDDWHYYYIYSLERVGQILGVDYLGDHEWYPLGARSLVKRQREDGSWTGSGAEKDPRLATAFALLFLTRATPQLDAAPEPEDKGPGRLATQITLPNQTPRVYVILDGSGSMLARIDGKPKFDIAREAVKEMISVLPDESQVALRVYGHRKRAIEPGADEDTALEIKWEKLDKPAFFAILDQLRPRGKTPLALSLEHARGDIRADKEPLIVVLLTDGGEDAGRDPIQSAQALGSLNNVRLYIVGFDINQKRWTDQLHAMARAAGGQYWPVDDAHRLTANLKAIVYPKPPKFVVKDSDGSPIGEHTFGGEPLELEPGQYQLASHYLGHDFAAEFWINPGATTRIDFDAAKVIPAEQVTHYAADPVDQPHETPESSTAESDTAGRDAPETMAPKFCTQCGSKLKADARFCTSCGQRVR